MNLPTQGGAYIADPIEWTVEETGQNKLLTFVCKFSLKQFLGAGDWEDISAHNMDITAWVYLFKKDGTPNQNAIDSIRESFGWTGGISDLATGQWAGHEVQLSVAMETYQGKTKAKVNFINPRDSVPGGITPATPETLKALEAKYGATFRAMGAVPAKPAAKAAPTPVVAKPTTGGKQAAWEAFTAKTPDMTDAERAENFKMIVGDCFKAEPGKDLKALTPAEWDNAAKQIRDDYDRATNSLLPF